MSKKYKLRILHISDLHIRGDRETDAAGRYRVLGPKWEENLKELLQRIGAIDIVCFTGDIADWGREQEYTNDSYRDATKFVNSLMGILKLPMERIFIVPGNHDIQRTVASEEWTFLRNNFRHVDQNKFSKWIRSNR